MKRAALHMLLALGALAAAYPFVWMLGTALKDLQEAARPSMVPWPAHWHWENFSLALSAAPFGRYFFNSFAVAIATTLAAGITSLMAAYAFARLRFPGRGPLFALVLATMMTPFEVTLIPNFVTIRALGWYDSYAALIVPWSANAFSIFLLRQALLGVPRDYFDAARIDGCGHLRFLVRVAAPLVKPMLITVALFSFLGSYNALLWPLVVTANESMRVVQVGLTIFAGDAGVRVNLLMCASAIVMLPSVALYFAAQRHLVESAIGAGIKG